ncbi:hypothetical protein BDF19DRAFT_453624 [Syncephalis fuscata]|nr:hypothetical protein BDF19DRAFT_453624 [Syncephalis fuscata]
MFTDVTKVFKLWLLLIGVAGQWHYCFAADSTDSFVKEPHGKLETLMSEGSLSNDCRKALDSQSLPNCGVFTREPMSFSDMLPHICNTTAGKMPSNYCTPKQANLALEIIGKGCATELQSGDEMVVDTYELWYTFGLDRQTICLRDDNSGNSSNNSSSNYCVLHDNAIIGLPKDMAELGDFTCDYCTKATIATILQWKPPSTPFVSVNKEVNTSLATLYQAAKRCDLPVTTNGLTQFNQSSSAIHLFYTSGLITQLLLLTSLMVLLLFHQPNCGVSCVIYHIW